MAESKLDSIKVDLEEELARLNENVKTLRQGLKKTEAERDRVKAVLDMLPGSGKKKSSSPAKKKPTAETDHVLDVMTAILEDNPSISRTELQELTANKLTEQEYALTGFKQRFEKLCDYPRFEVKGEKISLAEVPA